MANLPLELQWKYLLHSNLPDILSHCSASKDNDNTCKDYAFWKRYFNNQSDEFVNESLIYLSSNSQRYVIPAFEAAYEHNLARISDNTVQYILFESIMDNYEPNIQYFDNDKLLSGKNVIMVRESIMRVLNAINYNSQSEDNLKRIFDEFYYFIEFLDIGGPVPINIMSTIVSKISISAINKLYIASDYCKRYNIFVAGIIIVLAKQGRVKSLVSILKNVPMNKNVHIKSYYMHIAENLPLGLIEEFNTKLKIDLLEFMRNPREESRLIYWLANSSNVDKIMLHYNTASKYFTPEVYADIIYNADADDDLQKLNIYRTANYAYKTKEGRYWALSLARAWFKLSGVEIDYWLE